MNGKEVKGRFLKVDFDAKSEPRASYKINTDTTNNRLYNRDPIKNEKSKRIKKEKERTKMERMKAKGFAWDKQTNHPKMWHSKIN